MNEIKCSLEQDGFIGHYFPGTKSPEIAIIAVGGASCDEKVSILMSGYLREAGFNVLVVGFYLWKGLSKNLASVPVDYVENAVKWLRKKQGIQRIAMTGISTGAGYTLVCASLIPEITCIIPVVPFDYVLEGTDTKNRRLHCSVYTYHGKDLPYTECPMLEEGILRWLRNARRAKGYGLSRFMRYGYDQMAGMLSAESRIMVENSQADILFLAVKDDDCWPSDLAVPRMVKLLQENHYPHRVSWHIYEKGSHALADGIDQMGVATKMAWKLMIPTEKKYPKECEKARQDSFRRILSFIDEWRVREE